MFPELNFPSIVCKYKKTGGKVYIFDRIRKKFVFLSPEEWVRQHLVHFLIDQKKYPRSLIKIESGLKYNEMDRRSDLLVYNREGVPWMLMECKSFTLKIDQEAIQQVSIYGKSIQPEYLGVSNGMEHLCWRVDYPANSYTYIRDFPEYPDSGINMENN